MHWVIIGAGYTGTRLATRLCAARANVIVTRRSEAAAADVAAASGCARSAVVDLEDLDSLRRVLPEGAVVVDSAPPRASTVGERNLVRACAEAKVSRLVYLGSTGVYPPAAGGWVSEDEEPAPEAPRGQARLAAERALLAAARDNGLPAVALRIAGIYGPGRGAHLRLAAGTHRVVGSGDTMISRIHVDDLVTAIIAVATLPALPFEIVNVADDEPSSARETADGIAALLGVPPPPSVPPSEVSADVRAMLGADRCIDNTRLKSLGVELRYRSWREGMAAVLAEECGV